MQKGFTGIVVILIFAIFFGSLGFASYKGYLNLNIPKTESQNQVTTNPSPAPQPTSIPTPIPTSDKIANWQTYASELGFTFDYPAGSSVEESIGDDHGYIRIQNYTELSNQTMLDSGKYYLEITAYDKRKKQKAYFSTCTDVVTNYKLKGKVYIGDEADGGGDPGGTVKVACFQTDKGDILIRGTENNSEMPLINAIFATLTIK